jgi:hypothetical protein
MEDAHFKDWLEEKLVEADGDSTEESAAFWQFQAFSEVYYRLYGVFPNIQTIKARLSKE